MAVNNLPFLNLNVTPTFVFQPPSKHAANVEIWNTGGNTVYVGQSNVSPLNGIPVQPGQSIRLNGSTGSTYACSGMLPTGVANGAATAASFGGTTDTNGMTAGSTTLTFTATVPVQFTVGSTFYLGNATNAVSGAAEVLVTASTATSVATTTTPALFDHPASSIATIATNYVTGNVPTIHCAVVPGQIRVNAGIQY